jgi:iron complex transport system ATP-binding protein
VLHDLNHACRYATQLVAMKSGRIVAQSRPDPNDQRRSRTRGVGLRCSVIDDPETGTPLVVPSRRSARDPAALLYDATV